MADPQHGERAAERVAAKPRRRAEARGVYAKLAQLETAIERLNQGFCIFDSEYRLVWCNRRYSEIHEMPRELTRQGTPLRLILERRFEIGRNPSADREECIRLWTEIVGSRIPGKTLIELNNGRVICRDHQPLSDGGFVSIFDDVTEGLHTASELDRTKGFLDTVIEHVPAIVLVKDIPERRYTLVNRAAETFFGVPRAEMIGKNCYDIFSKEEADAIIARDNVALNSGNDLTISENALSTRGLGRRQVTVKRLVLRSADNEPQFLVQVLEDQTDRLKTQSELDRARNFLDAVIENIPTSILVKDARDDRHVVINRAAEAFLGVPRETMLGKTCHEIFRKEEADAITARDREALGSDEGILVHEHNLVTPAGETRSVITKRLRLNGADGTPQFFVIVIDDVTEQKRSAERIAYMAHHDTLTRLPNRATFNERLARAFEEAEASRRSFAVLCIDVDRFKEVNDVFGHAVGDDFLRVVSQRLHDAAQGAFLARFGGDEFTMITQTGAQPAAAEALVERLFETVVGDITIDTHQLRISLSVGISVFPEDGRDANTLLSNADAALYRAKREGRDTYRFFDAEMDRRTRERHALQHELRTGIARNELVLHYQPQARMKGAVVGFEALIRWQHPTRGMIPPGEFIPAAEENGLIVAIGEWTLREACLEAASWESPLQVAINLSPVQFRHGDLPSLVHRVLLETGLSADRLELEITESALIGDFARAVTILRRLKVLGVRIAMDDFGTGYSSLSYLQAFPFDKIKIDRSFISNLNDSPQSATIVRAVIGLARGLDLPVVAEGVETHDQLAFLTEEACDEVQGYLIGRPRPIDDYIGLTGSSSATTRRALLVG